MAAEIESEFGSKATLVPGGSGIYDVVVDGEMIFSKDQTGRFPEDGEFAQSIRARH